MNAIAPTYTTRMREAIGQTLQAFFQMAVIANEVREATSYEAYVDWIKAEFNFSDWYAKGLLRIYTYIVEKKVEVPPTTDRTALMLLATKGNVALLESFLSGGDLSAGGARALITAESLSVPYVRDMFKAQELAGKEAGRLNEALEHTFPEVRTLCEAHKVVAAGAVGVLAAMLNHHPEEFQSIVVTGMVQDGDFVIPLKDVTEGDMVDFYKQLNHEEIVTEDQSRWTDVVSWTEATVRNETHKVVGRKLVQFEVTDSVYEELMAHKNERVGLIVRRKVDKITAKG